MTLAEELAARGLIEQSSAPAEKILGGERTVYWGIDPSADSAHAGNLVSVLLMKRLGRAGHKLVFLVGGGTGMIGDPKEAGERPLLDVETIEKNVRTLEKQLRTILGSEQKFEMVNNADWLLKEKLVDFLRDIGKHFTVNELVKRDVIRRRLETPDESISYTEFAYSLLQGYDYYVLHQERGVDLQIGGSDQWTNILSGVELIRRKAGRETFALTVPIVTDSTGKKFGKSEGNAIWLDPKKTSPFQFYQFWLRLPDDGLEKYLKMYTFLSLGDIEALMLRHRAAPQEREAQETLASQVTELVHGVAAAAPAGAGADPPHSPPPHGGRGGPRAPPRPAAPDALYGDTPFEELSAEARAVALAEAPSLMLGKSELEAGYSLAEALVAGGLASSKSDARRLIEGKGITLSGLPITDPDQKLYPGDLSGGHALIRKGKRDVLILKLK